MKKYINVIVVDDSPIVRDVLTRLLNSDKQINVIAAVEDPYQAAKVIKKQVPDVITLDIEMPRMDGLTFLKKLMEQRPIPVVIISSLTKKGAESTFKAFEYGVPPHGGIAPGLDRLIMLLCNEPNIREVMAFPKTGDNRDLMMDAPSPISKKQLEEVHLKIIKN